MAMPTLLELADSGAHYGHHRSFVYPKAREYVYGVKQNVALINLEKTQELLGEAQKIFTKFKSEGKTVLFVGTKRGVQEVVRQIAESIGEPFITERWLGGFLTNFESIQENIKKMNELEEYLNGEQSKTLTKIERLRADAKLKRYHRFLIGVGHLKSKPELMVMASASQDRIALREANLQGLPIIAICDTDTNPELVTYPIPANDDAPKAVELILNALVAAPVKEKKTETIEKEAESVVEVPKKVAAKAKKEIKPKTTQPTKKTTVKKIVKAKKNA